MRRRIRWQRPDAAHRSDTDCGHLCIPDADEYARTHDQLQRRQWCSTTTPASVTITGATSSIPTAQQSRRPRSRTCISPGKRRGGTSGDYNTQTQPVLATEIAGHAGVLFVGGGSGRVYGYDATTGSLLWTRNTGQETYTCENGNTAYFGVGGTVAYDPASKSLYVVGNTNPSQNALATNSLYHLDAATGSVLGQVAFASAVTGWPSLDFSHTAVTLGGSGLAYVGTGATCDISSWRGRVAAIRVPAMTVANTFYTVWDPQNTRGNGAQPWGGGGVWGWGGVSLDANGNVFTGVGNTDNGSTTHGAINTPFVASPGEDSGVGDSFIKLSADLSTLDDVNHPIPQTAFSGDSLDLDLSGTPALFQPNGAGCDPMAALQGKSGTEYLYDAAHIGTGPVAQYQLAPSSYADGFLGGPAYSPATGLLYVNVTSSNESLFPPGMIAIDPGCGHPSVTWRAAFGPDSYAAGSDVYPGAQRSVPAVSAGGVVFVGTACTPTGAGTCAGSPSASASQRITAGAAGHLAAATGPRKLAVCCSPPGSAVGGAIWALNAFTGAVLNGGNPLLTTQQYAQPRPAARPFGSTSRQGSVSVNRKWSQSIPARNIGSSRSVSCRVFPTPAISPPSSPGFPGAIHREHACRRVPWRSSADRPGCTLLNQPAAGI